MAALIDFNQAENIETSSQVKEKPSANTSSFYEKSLLNNSIKNKETNSNFGKLIKVEPSECILWPYTDRPIDELGDISALAESLKQNGQQEPILLRPNQQPTSHKYEVIFGNRRWRAAQKVNIKLIGILKLVTDQEGALFQKEENENRKDISDFAKAISYKSQLDGGVFKSESELSKSLGMSKQTLNDIMSFIRVPEELRETINNYKQLSRKLVSKLATLSKNKKNIDILVQVSDKISSGIINSTNIEIYLASYDQNSKAGFKTAGKQRSTTYKINNNPIYLLKKDKTGNYKIFIKENKLNEINIDEFNSKLQSFVNSLLTT